jgi:NAD(P)-dependent dehydrogenase (short-subunit alcohol dehydrogenase family)
MGRAVAERFLADGERVWLSDLEGERLEEAVASLEKLGEVHSAPADVTVVADCERMVASVVADAGRLDVLVCAAGVWVEGPTVEMTEEEWDRTLDVNLKGLFFSCRYAIPHLVASGGCIVNISSDAGLVGTPETAIYCASKGGVNNLTRSLAYELAPSGVRVNAVCPNDVETPMLEFQAARYGGGDPDGYRHRLLGGYPSAPNARFIRPDEVAELIVFLASPKVAPITGACVPIDWAATAGY